MVQRSGVQAGSPAGIALPRPYRVAGVALAASALVVAIDPQHTHVPLCPFHAATGLQCPFCGSLRAVNHLARGHLAAAAHDNLLLVSALPVVAVVWVMWLLRGRPVSWPRWATVAAIVLTVAFAVVRNLPSVAALRPV